MCGGPFSPDIPELKASPEPEPEKQATPMFGASNKQLNEQKNQRAKKRGSSGFKIDIQVPGSKSGLNVGDK